MLNKVLVNQAEQIAVTPDQAAFVLKNKSDFKNQLDVDVSMYNTNIANSFINNKLQNNPDWNKYLQDPFRRNNPDYKRWKSVEDLMSEQEYTSIAEKYGDNLAKQADIVLDYIKPKNIWDRTAMGYNAARYGLRYAAARKDLSDALEDGDETRITEARNKLQEELFNLQYNSYEFESNTLNTGASIAASIARNLPAMIVSDLAITAVGGLTSGIVGAGVGAARIANRVGEIGKAAKITAEGIRAARIAKKAAKIAKTGVEASKTVARGGIVFGDTYKVESGSILQELDRSHPELSEDQKRDLAHAGGIINATIETIPMVMGIGFQAGMSKVLSKATTNAMLKSGVGSKVVSNPTFLREFKKQVEKNAFNFKKFAGDVALDMASNGIQEVLQDCIQKATEYVIDNPDTSVLEAGWDLFTDFVENPLADRNAEMLETLLNVMIVSPVFSAAPTIVDTTIKQIGSGSMYKKAAGAQKNRKLADDLNKWAKENEVNSVAPSVVNNNLANMVKNGDAPATVYFDVKSVQEALQSSEAEVQEAMQKLDMARRYEESKSNGGTIEMTLPEYNELVNQEKSGKLFQVVRSMVSFDPNSLSSAEFLRYMTTDGKALSVLEGAMEDSESAYNKAYNKFIESGWDEKQARFDATMAQLVSNRLASVTGGGMTGSEYFAKNVDIRTGAEQPTTEVQAQKISKEEKDRLRANYVHLKETLASSDIEVKPTEEFNKDYVSPEGSSYLDILITDKKGKKQVAHVRISDEKYGKNHKPVHLNISSSLSAEEIVAKIKEFIAKAQESDSVYKYLQSVSSKRLKKGELLKQETSQAVAGWFEREGDKLIVNLTKAANTTTFSHEMFHAFSNVLMEQYNNGQLSKYWKRQAENLFESVGAKPNADGKVVLTNTQEEHLADQFTTYILEGKVPSAEVSSMFALIKDWFKKAYLDFGIRHLGLNKKVIEVFDSIFMAQEEVEQRQRALAMIEFPMPEGADQGLYDKYVSHLLNSRAKASAKLVRAWYGLQKYKTSKEYTKRRGDIYNAVRSELEQSIAYQYQAILDKNNGDHVAAYNEYIGKHPEALESETPITPEVLQEMVDNLPTIDQEANRLTQQQIDEEMAVKFKIDKEPAANKALRNTEKVKALLAEALLHEGKKLSDFEAEYSAFLDNAERIIAKLSISAKKNTKGIRNFTYWVNQEGMAVERYAYAYAQQDKAEMAQQRRNQALFTMIRIRGEEIDNRAMRFKTQFQEKLRGNQKKEIINKDTGERADLYTADAWDLMQSIIEKFGFKIISKARTNKTVAEKMEAWIKDQENKSMTTIGFLRNFIPFIGKGYEGEFSQMSVNMFEQLENIMTAVNATARTEQFVIREGEKLHMNELKRDVAQTLEQKGIKPTTKAQGWLGKTFGGLGKWTNPEPVLQAFFSEKVLNAIFRPFFSAAAKADSIGNSWIARYRAARDKIKLTGKYTTYSNGVRLTDAQVVDLFLSMGTQHAYENFMKAFRINEEQAEQVVSEALTANPELANFVTEYWGLMSEAADAMNESHKKRMNRVLVRKEPRAFTINGIQFTGGYVPENKGLLREISEGDYNSLQMGLLSNEKEITKEADGTVKSIIDNTESRLGLFAKWAYAAPEYNNICKFMSDPEVKETVGEGLTEFIFNWLWAFQTPSVDTSGVVRPLTSLVSVAALGFRSMQGLIQLSGLVPAIATIGAKNVVFGLRKTIMTGDIFNPIKNARGKSAYMANRYDNPMGSILGFDKKDIKRTKLGDVYQRAGMSIIALFDAVVSSAVWEGAYADGISQGLSEQEATLKADAAVRVSQTDSMAASRSQALQSPWARAITSFATYIMGMQSVVRANLAAGERFKAALFAVNYMVFATFFESMYREAVNADDEDDDKKYIERVRTRWYNDMVKTLGSSAIPAFGFGGSVSAALASGIEKAFDVEDEIFESYAPSSALHTYLSQMYYLAQNVPAALVGDEEAQAKAIVNSIGLVSSEGKKIAKEWLNQ